MNYNEALKFIVGKQSLGIKPGLTRIKELLAALGNPQDKIKIIHIAGTNGKGTVAYTIADALVKSGKRVGLFTSPWIFDYREQIQLNGEYISEEDFSSITEELINRSLAEECTEFEVLTAIAYYYFCSHDVDYAVIECGMGGKRDATNVEKNNVCSVLTSISLDHTAFLGSTVEEITREKEGIIRNSPCFRYESTGDFNADNLSLVNKVLGYLGIANVNDTVRLPARQQKIGNILIDGGHNENAAAALAPLLNEDVAVIGMMRDKEVDKYLSLVAPHCRKIICTTPSNSRSMPADELALYAEKYCKDVIAVDNPSDAIEFAKNNELTLICGSFYLARDIIDKLL